MLGPAPSEPDVCAPQRTGCLAQCGSADVIAMIHLKQHLADDVTINTAEYCLPALRGSAFWA